MLGYWSSVPDGVWTVVDVVDALNVLRDSESRPIYDPKFNRINVLGPADKAIIIDLNSFEDMDRLTVLKELKSCP